MCLDQPTNRRGFTMIELLVVMTVITLMLSLFVGASFRFVAGARESATAGTVTKASGIIQDRVRAFHEFDFSDSAAIYASTYSIADVVLAEILIRKFRFKSAFPQAFAELNSAQITRFFPSAAAIPPTVSTYDSKYESGIVLYALLMNGETFGAATPAVDTFIGSEIKNTPQTGGLPCLVDAWGEPLRFYRWPTRLIRCAEQSFQSTDSASGYDDFNQNGQQDTLGGFQITTSPPIPFGITGSAPTRPCPLYPGSTPASLLISNLPPFARSSSYSTNSYMFGLDLAPGVAGLDDDGNGHVDWMDPPTNTIPDVVEVGWSGSDDPESLNTDPDDPTFRIPTYLSGLSVTNRNNFTVLYHDPSTFHSPLIVSAGQDKKLGLYEPTDVPTTSNANSVNFGYLAAPLNAPSGSTAYATTLQYLFDNITNLNQKSGGK